MSKETTVIVLGVLTFLVPFLGVPGTWKTAILLLVGAAVAVIGFLVRAETLSSGRAASPNRTFTESDHRGRTVGMDMHEREESGAAEI